MPIYEYISESDGTRLELLRPMSAADDPVTDPEGKGRRFTRVQSTFAAKGSGAGGSAAGVSLGGGGGCCPCGKGAGACNRAN